jgi:hypothetical protein
VKQETLFDIRRFLHFSKNRSEHDKTDENYDQLQKM